MANARQTASKTTTTASKAVAAKAVAAKAVVAKAVVAKAAAAKEVAAKAVAPKPIVTMKTITADLAEKHELTKKGANLLMDDFVSVLVKNLKKGNRIRIPGLGSLQVRKHAARKGRNPATGEMIKIPAKKKIAFRAAKDLKEAIGK